MEIAQKLIDQVTLSHRQHLRCLLDAASRIRAAENLASRLRRAGIRIETDAHIHAAGVAIHLSAHAAEDDLTAVLASDPALGYRRHPTHDGPIHYDVLLGGQSIPVVLRLLPVREVAA